MIISVPYTAIGEGNKYINDYFKVRKTIFYDRMKWDVNFNDNSESDEFDAPFTHYLLSYNPMKEKINGGVRLRPSFLPNLTYDIFGTYFKNGIPIKPSSQLLESSRFCLLQEELTSSSFIRRETIKLLREMFLFSLKNNYTGIIAIVDVIMERVLKILGLDLHRVTEVIEIGGVKTTTILLPVSEEIYRKLDQKIKDKF